ncbi:family 18 glycoside hydrolase [Stachybotrys elegans]|uniref:chitinase n=1 Tax=Stachybotrys elegans TaxID=80388 RepID=A0A8K0SUZ5_9HYPO|nr:family 18 glycoside hydrolase [Stachybotrys elegans]
MPPLPPTANPLPRLITYYQTHHDASGKSISILPLLMQPGISLTHVIVAAIHINSEPNALTLNDHPPDHPRFQTLWAELRILQASGIKVMGMLGGAAKGSYERLDGSDEQFERFYLPVRDLVRDRNLDGIDLDVEEKMSLGGIIRLIDRLRADFGKDFIITLAPVAAALLDSRANLSGFDYEALEVMRGRDISWYNTQFYCGWGDISNTRMYDVMMERGWPVQKVVVGVVTHPDNGSGFVPFEMLPEVIGTLKRMYGQFGGIMGWEYFNGMPGGRERPWEWARQMTTMLRGDTTEPTPAAEAEPAPAVADIDGDSPHISLVPDPFTYHSEADE